MDFKVRQLLYGVVLACGYLAQDRMLGLEGINLFSIIMAALVAWGAPKLGAWSNRSAARPPLTLSGAAIFAVVLGALLAWLLPPPGVAFATYWVLQSMIMFCIIQLMEMGREIQPGGGDFS